jgi:hypothetical protein
MGSPFEGHQDVNGVYSNEFDFFMPPVLSAPDTSQVNSGYTQNASPNILTCELQQSWSSLSRNDSNPYPDRDQIFNDVSSHTI